METESNLVLTEQDTYRLIGRLITKALLVLIGSAAAVAIQIFRVGVTGRYALLLASSALSIIVLFAYRFASS